MTFFYPWEFLSTEAMCFFFPDFDNEDVMLIFFLSAKFHTDYETISLWDVSKMFLE